MTDEERERKFQFFKKVDLDFDDSALSELKFWLLSKKSDIYGKGTGDHRRTMMCRHCGAIVGDHTVHAQWHADVEQRNIQRVALSSNY